MSDVEIHGGESVDALVRRIRTHGDAKAIRKDLTAGLNRATIGTRADMKAAIPGALPRRGGLAALVHARVSLTTAAVTGRNAGVRIRARHRQYDLKALNEGRIRHPVYGNRGTWVLQTRGITPGFLDHAFDRDKPHITHEVSRVLDDIARRVEH